MRRAIAGFVILCFSASCVTSSSRPRSTPERDGRVSRRAPPVAGPTSAPLELTCTAGKRSEVRDAILSLEQRPYFDSEIVVVSEPMQRVVCSGLGSAGCLIELLDDATPTRSTYMSDGKTQSVGDIALVVLAHVIDEFEGYDLLQPDRELADKCGECAIVEALERPGARAKLKSALPAKLRARAVKLSPPITQYCAKRAS